MSPTTIRFDRRLSEARPFEARAYAVVARRAVEVIGRDLRDVVTGRYVSAQFLSPGEDRSEEALSVFFRLVSFGGSGGSLYHFLALRDRAAGLRVYGLSFETSEAGRVLIGQDRTGAGYRDVLWADRQYLAVHAYDADLGAYDEVPRR